MNPTYFESAAEWRKWLQLNHKTTPELLVGFYKRASDRPCMTWSESVDEAICFGWIDAVRRRIDDDRYSIRFCPRKSTSVWSKVNIAKAKALVASKKMTDAGAEKFLGRTAMKSGVYSFEQKDVQLDAESIAQFRKNKTALAYFESLPPGYKKRVSWHVVSAKRSATRDKRLTKLIEACAEARRI